MNIYKNTGTLHAQVVADYILQHYGPMSHLKLQKLLYYCQGYHLAYFDCELFPEDFQAWVHGPVCREVFNNLKENSLLYSDLTYDGIDDTSVVISNSLNSDQISLLNDVLSELSKWSGFELENATHQEQPWIDARRGYSPVERCETIISKNLMQEFYKKEING